MVGAINDSCDRLVESKMILFPGVPNHEGFSLGENFMDLCFCFGMLGMVTSPIFEYVLVPTWE